jgi:hypothetical protein
MCVSNLQNFHGSHSAPIDASVVLDRKCIVSGDEDQPTGMIQIDAKLTFSISGQFMAARRGHPRYLLEVVCCLQLHQPHFEFPRPLRPHLSEHCLLCAARFLELLVVEKIPSFEPKSNLINT